MHTAHCGTDSVLVQARPLAGAVHRPCLGRWQWPNSTGNKRDLSVCPPKTRTFWDVRRSTITTGSLICGCSRKECSWTSDRKHCVVESAWPASSAGESTAYKSAAIKNGSQWCPTIIMMFVFHDKYCAVDLNVIAITSRKIQHWFCV